MTPNDHLGDETIRRWRASPRLMALELFGLIPDPCKARRLMPFRIVRASRRCVFAHRSIGLTSRFETTTSRSATEYIRALDRNARKMYLRADGYQW
jgi:hypothetical protein